MEATDREQAKFIVVTPGGVPIVAIHVPEVGLVAIALIGTPPVAIATNIGEMTARTA